MKKKTGRLLKRIVWVGMIMLILGYFMPQRCIMPVKGAGSKDYHPESFWYYPWGKSGTHKGVDIFAKKGTPVLAATGGLVVFKGEFAMGGKVVLVLGPKWRFHYYAHLDTIETSRFHFLNKGEQLGRVGNSGNAKGKPSHLHYTIATPIPYPWRYDADAPQGWRKMFYLNPIDAIN